METKIDIDTKLIIVMIFLKFHFDICFKLNIQMQIFLMIDDWYSAGLMTGISREKNRIQVNDFNKKSLRMRENC